MLPIVVRLRLKETECCRLQGTLIQVSQPLLVGILYQDAGTWRPSGCMLLPGNPRCRMIQRRRS